MKILFAAAEAAPIAKVGGMADVVGTLPAILRQLGHDVRIIMPYYGVLPDRLPEQPTWVWKGNTMFTDFEVFATALPGTDVPLYLVGHPAFMPSRIYYGDDEDWRFTLFAAACAEFAWNYWKPNLIHCHDWHTGMIPVWMHQTSDIGTVFTIHNLAYQGPWRWRLEQITWVPWYMQGHNTMAAGIRFADRVNTVSPTYAQQICTPAYGEGLENTLSYIRPWGILNGIDTNQLDPATDKFIVQNFTADTLELRLENKIALQQELGLEQSPSKFLVGMVSRLVEQKGLDILIQVLDRFLAYTDAQFVVLGTGDRYYENQMWQIASRYPGRMSAQIFYNAALSQRIYASTDAFLMPSRFEPCGISQMIALRYGSIPIVRRTGGLVDTVFHQVPQLHQGNGFCFDRYEPLDLYTCMVRAYESYQYPDNWRQVQQRGMATDFSWNLSAQRYIELYRSIPGMEKA
ncbi:MAG: glycogen synthase GlgA [Pseudanabaenaceae cyanobacterium bins.68]|nr:glycogen synthase GlgA [Pseudanabaenaceae cyanobacterium bins.68]